MKSLLAGMMTGVVIAITGSAIIDTLHSHRPPPPTPNPPMMQDTVRPALD